MRNMDNDTIEINGTVYKLFIKKNCSCTSCDAEPYCNKYELFQVCGGPYVNTIFKKVTLNIGGSKYVAKMAQDTTAGSICSTCDIPKSTCMKHNLINKCAAIHPHVHFEKINIEQDDKKHEEIHKKRKFNPKNCQRSIKDRFTVGEVTFTLSCHHSFEWTIAKTENGKITIDIYPNRNAAKKEYERKKKLSK